MHTQQNLRQGQHLIKILQSFRGLESTRKRDQLFAFWGLACGDLPIPDYRCPSRTVFIQIAKWLLEDAKDLLLLAMGLRPNPQLPSWVPDWASKLPFENNYWRRRLHCLDSYDSAKDIERSIRFTNPDTLCLSGIMVGKVADVAQQRLTSENTVEHAAMLRNWQGFAADSSRADESLALEFSETMIAGCSHQSSSSFPAATARDVSLCQEVLVRMMTDGNFDDDANELLAIRQAHLGALWDRVLFRSSDGRLGLGPSSLRKDDEVWIMGGGQAPFILRQAPEHTEYPSHRLVGHAYVNGIMQGEAVKSMSSLQECRLV